jgi:hypothetical protein
MKREERDRGRKQQNWEIAREFKEFRKLPICLYWSLYKLHIISNNYLIFDAFWDEWVDNQDSNLTWLNEFQLENPINLLSILSFLLNYLFSF